MPSLNLSRRPRRRPDLVAGATGLRVTWGDGTITLVAPGARLTLASWGRQPVRIEGRALLSLQRGGLGFEAPALTPSA